MSIPSTPPPPPQPPTSIETPLTFATQLPALASPSSPYAAALYTARVQLLLDLPASSTKGWCCSKCGHLRDGYGWRMISGGGGRRKGRPVGKKSKVGKGKKVGSKGTITMMAETQPSGGKYGGATSPKDRAKNVLKGTCSMCGTSFRLKGSDIKTLGAFPSARSVARRTRAKSQEEEGGTAPVMTDTPLIDSQDDPFLVPPSQPTTPAETPTNTSPGKPQPPNLFQASPLLAHVPSTSDDDAYSNPSTSPFPPNSPSTLPPVSSPLSRSASPVGGMPKSAGTGGAGAKKKKKGSGLAKLLAASAERKEEEERERGLGGLGKWGLN